MGDAPLIPHPWDKIARPQPLDSPEPTAETKAMVERIKAIRRQGEEKEEEAEGLESEARELHREAEDLFNEADGFLKDLRSMPGGEEQYRELK